MERKGFNMLKIYVDAATKGNPGASGAGIQLISENLYQQLSFPLPVLTNHEAEFAALELALLDVIKKDLNHQNTIVYTDSKIVAQTIEKDYTGNPLFSPYLKRFRELYPEFPLLIIQWLPEKENKGADNLARQGLQKALKNEKKKK